MSSGIETLQIAAFRATKKPRREEETARILEEIKSRYGVRWWLSTDPYEIVSYQLQEQVLLVPYERLKSATELVLGRSVFDREFYNPKRLLAELDSLNALKRRL